MDSDSFLHPGVQQKRGSNMMAAVRVHWIFIALIGLAVWFFFLKK